MAPEGSTAEERGCTSINLFNLQGYAAQEEEHVVMDVDGEEEEEHEKPSCRAAGWGRRVLADGDDDD